MVKSARRAFELLEQLDDAQEGLTVMELARRMAAPQSSVSALANSMVELGYLTYDRAARTFRPTARVAVLGSWIYTPFFGEGRLHRLMEELRDRTGQKIILATRTGLMVRSIHSIEGTQFSGPHFRLGAPRSIARSAFGCLFLSEYRDEEITMLVRRINAERSRGDSPIDATELLKRIYDVRESGYCFAAGILTSGLYVLSVLLPPIQNEPPLAIGIGSLSAAFRERRAEYVQELRSGIRKHLCDAASDTATTGRSVLQR